jgi:hypothetical protein
MSTSITTKVSEAAKVVLGIPNFLEDAGLVPNSETAPDLASGYIWNRLRKLGIYSDEESNAILESNDCTEGDARKVFCENGEPNLPVARFKRVWSILKGRSAETGDILVVDPFAKTCETLTPVGAVEQVIKAMRPIDTWSDEELVAQYGPDCASNIVDDLIRRSKGRAFVVFKDEAANVVDVATTLRMLKEARKRETPVNYKVADMLKRLYRAGDFPSQVYHECPLHPGVLLIDDYCDKCGHSWEAVKPTARQFVRIIAEMGEAPKDGPGIRQLVNTAAQGDNALSGDYPKVYMRYLELVQEDRLPSLKSRTSIPSGVGRSDPFAVGKRY